MFHQFLQFCNFVKSFCRLVILSSCHLVILSFSHRAWKLLLGHLLENKIVIIEIVNCWIAALVLPFIFFSNHCLSLLKNKLCQVVSQFFATWLKREPNVSSQNEPLATVDKGEKSPLCTAAPHVLQRLCSRHRCAAIGVLLYGPLKTLKTITDTFKP